MSTTVTANRQASAADLFRFSALTWNAHLIHLDPEYARSEGLDGVVVQAHLHGAWLWQLAESAAGPGGTVTELEWRNLRPLHAGETAHITATPEDSVEPGSRSYLIESRDDKGRLLAAGRFVVRPGGNPT